MVSGHHYRFHFEGRSKTLSKSNSNLGGWQILCANILNWSVRLHDSRTQSAKSNCKVLFVQRHFDRSVNWHSAGTSTLTQHSCYGGVNKRFRGTAQEETYSACGICASASDRLTSAMAAPTRRATVATIPRTRIVHACCQLGIQKQGIQVVHII